MRSERGLTTLELVTMLSISMALATALVPVIRPVLQRAETARAQYRDGGDRLRNRPGAE